MSAPQEIQPALFDLQDCERHLVELASDQSRFTGTTAGKDAQLVRAVLGAVVAGVPHKQIAALARISVHTVMSLVERAEGAGEIAPYKERMNRLLSRGAELLAATIQNVSVAV